MANRAHQTWPGNTVVPDILIIGGSDRIGLAVAKLLAPRAAHA
jgi:hypothetical protein